MYRAENLHNFVPDAVTPKRIGIIGGRGEMGQLLAREFSLDGYDVTVTGEASVRGSNGRSLQRLNRAVVRDSDVIIFAVPIEKLCANIQEILGSNLSCGFRGKLVMDVASTKVEPLQQLCLLKGPSIIGTHPMFGPKVKDFKNLNVVVCPTLQPSAASSTVMRQRLDRWVEWIEHFWRKRGANIRHMSATAHDRLVPAVQFDVLLATIAYANTLRATGANLKDMTQLSTPNSRVLCATMARMLAKEMAPTYANIAFENQANLRSAEAMAAGILNIVELLRRRDKAGFQDFLNNLGAWLAPKTGDDLRSTAAFMQVALANREFIEEMLQKRKQMVGAGTAMSHSVTAEKAA